MKSATICLSILALLLSQSALANPPATSAPIRIANATSEPYAFGPLRLGLSEEAVEKAMGQPEIRYSPQIDSQTGKQVHATSYANGVSLTYSDKQLISLTLEDRCDWKGLGGLQVGLVHSKATAIVNALIGKNVQPFPMDNPEDAAVTFQDSKTLLLVRTYQGKVSYIYLGPPSE